MRRVIPILLLTVAAIASLAVSSGDAKTGPKPKGERALSVLICVGSACAPSLTGTDAKGVAVSLKATANQPDKTVDHWPAPMKYAGTVKAPTAGIACPPKCSTMAKLQGKTVTITATPGGSYDNGFYDFGRWDGVVCAEGQASRTCTIHVNGNPHARAFFYNN